MPSDPKKITVLIVESHAGLRDGLRAIIDAQPDMTVVGEANNGESAMERHRELQPDITIIEVDLPVICGLKVTAAIRAEFPRARVIIITALDDERYSREAREVGAQKVLHKATLRRELIGSIRAILAGDRT